MPTKVTLGNIADLVDGVVEGLQRGSPLPTTEARLQKAPQLVNLANVTTAGAAILRAAGLQATKMNLLSTYNVAVFMLTVTPLAGAEAGDTLDIYVDLSLDGNTYFNAVHFTQVIGTGGVIKFVAQLTHPSAAVADINVTSDAAANAVRNLWAPHVRVGHVVVDVTSNSTAKFIYTLDVYLQSV